MIQLKIISDVNPESVESRFKQFINRNDIRAYMDTFRFTVSESADSITYAAAVWYEVI